MKQHPLQHPLTESSLTPRDRFLAALHCRRVDRPPVWFMRQAGRHLPGYRALRKRASFLDLCRDEDLNVRASCEPWERYGVDAVIVFNDILIPLRDMGLGLAFAPGPHFERLITSPDDVRMLDTPAYDGRTDVCRCLSAIRSAVTSRAGLLGFVGAPFTVAAFAVAGAGVQRIGPLSEVLPHRRTAFEALNERLVDVLARYAAAQVSAGADAIQIFESLGDEVPEPFYREAGLPFLIDLIGRVRALAPGVPVIAFGRGMWPFLNELADTGAAALSLDGTRPLEEARAALRECGFEMALQGNLDPAALRRRPEAAARQARALLARWSQIVPHPAEAPVLGPTGWLFNLGHGVPKDADPDAVQAVVDAVCGFETDIRPESQEEQI